MEAKRLQNCVFYLLGLQCAKIPPKDLKMSSKGSSWGVCGGLWVPFGSLLAAFGHPNGGLGRPKRAQSRPKWRPEIVNWGVFYRLGFQCAKIPPKDLKMSPFATPVHRIKVVFFYNVLHQCAKIHPKDLKMSPFATPVHRI